MAAITQDAALHDSVVRTIKITARSYASTTESKDASSRTHAHTHTDAGVSTHELAVNSTGFIVDHRVYDASFTDPPLLLAPAFVDTQFNGCMGMDVSADVHTHTSTHAGDGKDIDASKTPGLDTDGGITATQVYSMLDECARMGVGSVAITVISSSRRTYEHVLEVLDEVMDEQDASDVRLPGSWKRARILGVHLEGPYLSPNRKGAHTVAHLRAPAHAHQHADSTHCIATGTTAAAATEMSDSDAEAALVATYGERVLRMIVSGDAHAPRRSRIGIMTLAPELPGALSMIRYLTMRGVVVAIGHSEADLDVVAAAVAAGARTITHMYNAMAPLAGRAPGIIGALAEEFEVPESEQRVRPYFSIIADGVHVHPACLRLAASVHPGGLVLVTDAMPALGLPPGTHRYGTATVTVHAGAELGDGAYKGKHAVVAGTSTLAGAVAPLHECVRHSIRLGGIDPALALAAATATPAKLLGRSDIGELRAGSRADFVLLDEDFAPLATFLGGAPAWIREDAAARVSSAVQVQ